MKTTRYGYDELDRQTNVTNALGDVVTTQYDRVGNIIAISNALLS